MTVRRPQSPSQAKSATRAFDILETLASNPTHGHTFTELLEALSYPKSSLHELLAVLTDRGYVRFDSDSKRYALGSRVWELGQAFVQHRQIVDETRPAMDEIVSFLNETSQLAVLDGLENVYLAKVDCTHPLRIQTDIGKRFPAHATALGKVLLAHLAPGKLNELLAGSPRLAKFTANTITDHAELMSDLAKVLTHGFAVDDEEGMQGLKCYAVPIRDSTDVIAAMSVSIPTLRTSDTQGLTAVRLLARQSLTVSRHLGAANEDERLLRLLDLEDGDLLDLIRQRNRSH